MSWKQQKQAELRYLLVFRNGENFKITILTAYSSQGFCSHACFHVNSLLDLREKLIFTSQSFSLKNSGVSETFLNSFSNNAQVGWKSLKI